MQAITFTIGTARQKVLGPDVGGALIQADPTNTSSVFVGSESVTADSTATGGILLAAGAMVPLVIVGDEPLWAVASVAGQLLRVVYGTDTPPVEIG